MGEGEGVGFDAAAADGAGGEASGGDEHFGAGVLGYAAERLDEGHEHERGRGGFEGDELGVEGEWGGHGVRGEDFQTGFTTDGTDEHG